MTGLLYFALGIAVVWSFWLARHRMLSFQAQRAADYEHFGPEFVLSRHLAGALVCHGVIYGPSGRVVSRFVADMTGEWTESGGVLRESFRFDSGATQERAWHLTLAPDGTIRAEADDIVGHGSGAMGGPCVGLTYRIKLPEDAGGHTLDVVDWMHLLDNGVIMNRSQFRKFGVKVAELVATIERKREAA
ncbi:Protein of unknown function [Tranquillimonas rosea]|uniref:DUF3833 domain-containing protein n=1 Tax=Tranquillimonas rosea TaxID=641238 RepID=A0A1H9W7M8_9RHOB|nr:DUF3833 family protein [Tranquillimonas rosea]SES29824.1 Protein of unknown function [Tranquillimonas rosea]